MTLPALPSWVPWTAGAVLVAGGIILGLALLADWAKGLRAPHRRRCPRCWYEMVGVPGLMCPECGRTPKSEKKLGKSRQRWGWAVIGLLMAVPGAIGVAYPTMARQDWIERIPSWVLVRYADPIVNRNTYQYQQRPSKFTRAELMMGELCQRYERGELSLAVRRRCTAEQFGNGSRDPITLETRTRWPAGTQVLVMARPNFGGPLPRSLTAAPQFAGAREVIAYDEGWGGSQYRDEAPAWLQPIGVPPDGTSVVECRVFIDEGSGRLWEGRLKTPITVSGAVDEVIQPVVLPAAEEAIREALARTIRVDADGEWLIFEPPVQVSTLAGITVGLVIEFRYDGVRVAGARTLWIQEEDAKERAGSSGWYRRSLSKDRSVQLEGDTKRLTTIKPSDPHWTVYVRGDGETALRDFKATQYWSGEFEIKPYSWGVGPTPQP